MTKPEKVACQNPKEICAQNRKSSLTKHTSLATVDGARPTSLAISRHPLPLSGILSIVCRSCLASLA